MALGAKKINPEMSLAKIAWRTTNTTGHEGIEIPFSRGSLLVESATSLGSFHERDKKA
jgi:hypothetical protein